MRPRYGRIAVFTAAATVTAIAVLGGFGLLRPVRRTPAPRRAPIVPSAEKDLRARGATDDRAERAGTWTCPRPGGPALHDTTPQRSRRFGQRPPDRLQRGRAAGLAGRWLGRRWRTYLVSGSATDNLDPGTYYVYSRSRWAVGIDDSGTMQYFVRFAHGDEGGAIGFHTIPVDDGAPVQTTDQLGTPLSHGCVRQRTADAVALWDFAPIGTTVVVTE